MVLAPLDANTLAKVATGLCDNLLVNAFKNLRFHLTYIVLTVHWIDMRPTGLGSG